jgi:predicted Fe-Mo cluster-binding NifX family protein/DNA-directed RNA polymerase subunit RPC12/RpoP
MSKNNSSIKIKIGVASQGSGGLDDFVAPVFARCPTFTIIEIHKNKIEKVTTIPNEAAYAFHGAGIAAIQKLASLGVSIILAGAFGPNVAIAANQLGIQTIVVQPGNTIKKSIEDFIAGKLKPVLTPTVPPHRGLSVTPTSIGFRRGGGFGVGSKGYCVCPNCGYRVIHMPGSPCVEQICPQCGSRMMREF